MKASFHRYILNFKRPSGTSRGIMTQKETWFIVIESEGKTGIGECGILRGLSFDDRPGFGYRSKWNLIGTVEHWGHVHQRTNQYDAEFAVQLVDGSWKITNLKVLDESQGPVKTSMRKF